MKRTYLILTLGALASTSFQMYASHAPAPRPVIAVITKPIAGAPKPTIREIAKPAIHEPVAAKPGIHEIAKPAITVDPLNNISIPKGGVTARFEPLITTAPSVFKGKVSGLEVNASTSSSTIAANISKQLKKPLSVSEQSLLQKSFDQARKPGGSWDPVNKQLEAILNKRPEATLTDTQFTNALDAAQQTGTFTDVYNKIMSFFGGVKNSVSRKVAPNTTVGSDTVITLSDPISQKIQAKAAKTILEKSTTGGFEQAPAAPIRQAATRTKPAQSQAERTSQVQTPAEPAAAQKPTVQEARAESLNAQKSLTAAQARFNKAVSELSADPSSRLKANQRKSADDALASAENRVEFAQKTLTEAQDFKSTEGAFDRAEAALPNPTVRQRTAAIENRSANFPGWQ